MVLFVNLAILMMALTMVPACSSRVGYAPPNNAAASAGAVNINTASAAELERLPHIGRSTAEAIVKFREANGPFRRPEHLMQIRGISETRFAEIKQYIRTE